MKTARIFLSVVFFFVLASVVLALLFERVPPATFGVKQNLWGGGVVEKLFVVPLERPSEDGEGAARPD